MFKKALSILLVVLLIMSSMPMTALANMGNTKGNTAEKNQQILDTIPTIDKNITSKDDMLIQLQNLGLLDGEGELVTSSIEVDIDGDGESEPMTLDDIRAMVNAEDVDLTQIVSVDGTSITLENFKKMLEIEDKLASIRSEYLESNITITEAHEMALQSLMKQLMAEGITIELGDGTVVRDISGVHKDVRVSIETSQSSNSVTVTARLNKEQTENVSFHYQVLDGSFSGAEKKSGVLTIPKGQTSASFNVNYSIPSGERWGEDISFYIKLNRIENAFFDNDKENKTIKVSVMGNYDYYEIYKTFRQDSPLDNLTSNWDIVDQYDYLNYTKRIIIAAKEKLSSGEQTVGSLDLSEWSEERKQQFYELYDEGSIGCIRNNYAELYVVDYSDSIVNIINVVDFKLRIKFIHNNGSVIKEEIVKNNSGSTSVKFSDGTWASGRSLSCSSYMELPQNIRDLKRIDVTLEHVNNEGYDDGHSKEIPKGTKLVATKKFGRFQPFIFDTHIKATVENAYVSDGNYEVGDMIPIVVEFSQPVKGNDGVLWYGDEDDDYLRSEENSVESWGYSHKLSFLYPSTLPTNTIDISKIVGERLNGYDSTTKYSDPKTLTIPSVVKAKKEMAFTRYNVTVEGTKGRIELPLNTENSEYCSWVIAEAQENDNAGIISSMSAKVVGENHGSCDVTLRIDDLANPTKVIGEFTAPLNRTDHDVKYIPAFYLDREVGSSDNKTLLYGVDASYTLKPTVFLEDGDFTIDYEKWPSDLSKDLYIDEIGALDLGVTISGDKANATFQSPKDFLWESSDDSIATIDSKGKIVFTGKNGQVYFTVTARNGDVEGQQISITTETLAVKAGLTPFLIIPEGANIVTATKGNSAQLRWSSNIVQKKIDAEEPTETDFNIYIYKAEYDGDTINKGDEVYNTTLVASERNQISSYDIPKEVMTDISVIGKVSYVVEVTSEGLTATGYIEVKSSPAVVTLTPLDNLFITDSTDSVTINYTVDNFDDVNADSEFEFKIIKNEETTPIVETTDMTGSYNLQISDVAEGDLKDVYTVTVRAKNALEPTWSYDSYVLYVYKDNALKINIDGVEAGETLVLDNTEKIANMSSAKILDMKREIALDRQLSINNEEYEWSQLGDMVKWSSSNKDPLAINSYSFGSYIDIAKFNSPMYSPGTEFMLSGLQDGESKVTATHGLTKMSDSLNVSVTTLKDKLYLFQVFPKTRTELTYYLENGEEKKAYTNNSGAAAIYDENGINSDIYLKSTFDNEVYLGTIYKDTLKTKEQDLAKNQLYPLNTIELRPITKPRIVLNAEDGTPYDGDVILRGGAYKNNEYCPEAFLNGKDGKLNQTVHVNDGVLEVGLDSTQFWINDDSEELKSYDDIELIFEVQFPGKNYYPEIIKVKGNVNRDKAVRTAENSVVLVDADASDLDSPYNYKSKVVFKKGSEIIVPKNTSKVGPSKNFNDISLVTDILCLGGQIGDAYSSKVIDQFKTRPKGQSYEIIEYPFSSFPILKHTLKLNKNTIWMPDRVARSISVKINKDDKQVAKLPYSFKVVNLINVDITEDGEIKNYPNKMLSEIMKSDDNNFTLEDEILSTVLEGIASVEGLDTSVIQMMIRPTSDPAVFDTIIKINIGYGNVGGIDDSKETGVYVTDPTEDAGEFGIEGVDGALDMQALSKKQYKADGFKGNGKTQKMTSISPSFEGGGYITGKIRYNFDDMSWDMFTTSNNIHAAAGINTTLLINSKVGTVPVTAEFNANGSVEFAYSMASHSGTTIEKKYNEEFVNDYLKELRFDLYVKAFGGVGVDYSIVALKVGVFGEQDVSLTKRWLYQGYLRDDNLFGREIRADGRVGIELKAKVGLLSYKKILASAGYSAAKGFYSWDEIDEYWEKYKNGSIQNEPIGVISSNTFNNRGMDMEVAYETVTLEGRDYLENYDRVWKGPTKDGIAMGKPLFLASLDGIGTMSIDANNEVDSLETNSYPYSNPMFTDDGELMVYLSDMDSSDVEKTKVCFSKRSGNSYEEGSELYDDNEENKVYGDSYLNVDGDSSFAAATWVTQTESIKKDAGTELTNEDITLMNNSTEIMVSIYNGTSWSEPVALSDNSNADLAPVVATNGDKVLIAWRSSYADDAEKPLEFGGNDKIVYKVYDKTLDTWTAEQVLYNGTLGNIMGIEAEMLTDGTSSVVYTVEKTVGAGDPDATQNNNNLEVLYSVIDGKGEIVQSVRATNDDYVDENPKITTHTFDDGTERFVIGWYSVNDASDIRLSAYNNQGAIYNGFIDSIKEAVSNSEVTITSKFKFAKGDSTDDIAIVWSEPMKSDTSDDESVTPADKDGLYAVKILDKDQRYYATAPNELAVMDDYTLIDHFDARTTDTGDIKAVLLATDYNSGVEKEYPAEDGKTIYVKEGVSELLTATSVFSNNIRIDSVYYDLESVRPGMEIPIQFEIYNSGIDEINSVDIEFDEVTKKFALDTPILSGRNKTLTIYYTVPETIKDVDYTVKAYYQSEDVSQNGKLYMVFPDVGISRMDIVEESEGMRDITLSLYNDSAIKIDHNIHRVMVNFYDNANLEGEPLKSVTITDSDDIEKINQGTYSKGIEFELADLLQDENNMMREIPRGGITIYGYAKIEELDDDDEYIDLLEINAANNRKSVTFESLIEKQNNQKVTILTKQRIEDDKTIVEVTVQNNSLVETTNGNLIVSIKNKAGEVVEQKESFDVSKENSGLITLGYEQKDTQSFQFDSVAEFNEVLYSETILDADNADLGSLSFEGLECYFDSNVEEYTISSDKPISTIMEFTTANPNATAKVDGVELSQNKLDININSGTRQIAIEVTSADGTVTKKYMINIGVKVYNNSNGSSSSKKDRFKNGEKVVVNLWDNKNIPIDYFKQLEDGSGRSLVLDGSFYTIEFSSGQTIRDVNEKSINFGLSLESPNEKEISTLVKSEDVVNIYFTHHGELPARAKVKIDIGKSYKGKKLYLYYYNEETNKLENYGLLKVDSYGKVEFELDHFSDYILCEKLLLRDGLLVENIDNISYVSGYSDGTFRPDGNITRAEVAKLFDNILTDVDVDSNKFTDCDMWAKDSILQLSSLGLVNGYSDNTFRPNNKITRAEFVKLITNILDIEEIQLFKELEFNDISNSWAKNEIGICYKLGIVNGYGESFKPNNHITRAEAVTIINRIIGRDVTSSTGNSNFSDVPESHWAYPQIINAIK